MQAIHTAQRYCLRLGHVAGVADKTNEIVFCGKQGPTESNVVFFGGDVQEYSEVMLAHRDNGRYVKWNLQSTAQGLLQRFPNSHIWVIKPHKMHLKTFSVYSNFVKSNAIGVPEHSENQGSWCHLQELLKNACDIVTKRTPQCQNPPEDQKADTVPSPGTIVAVSTLPLTLVAFSKGCVVLNQLLYDLPSQDSQERREPIIELVNHIYWLDGGHNGGSNTWITQYSILKKLVNVKARLHVHVTPYQMKDEFRKWIGKEEKAFVEKLKNIGRDAEEIVHFEDEERSLTNHFLILEKF